MASAEGRGAPALAHHGFEATRFFVGRRIGFHYSDLAVVSESDYPFADKNHVAYTETFFLPLDLAGFQFHAFHRPSRKFLGAEHAVKIPVFENRGAPLRDKVFVAMNTPKFLRRESVAGLLHLAGGAANVVASRTENDVTTYHRSQRR